MQLANSILLKNQTKKMKTLTDKICELDSYIGMIAQSEVIFWKLGADTNLDDTFDLGDLKLGMMADQYKQSMINVADQANQGVSILEELIFDEPQKLLAYVKLWQFYRTQATFEPLKSENLALSTEIAEKLTKV